MYTMGVDIGSASSKVVILKDGKEIVAAKAIQLGTGSSGPGRALQSALAQAGLSLPEMAGIVATGYGRFAFTDAQKQYTEIRCQAVGTFFQVPTARTIIDIGGQDVKAIHLDNQGNVRQFFMNDKCAAGTGRFLDVMSRVLEVGLDKLAEYDARATEAATVSSTCTVFAESEVISLLSQGVPIENIVAGVHRSVAIKACALARRGIIKEDVVMCGGVAQNAGVVRAIMGELQCPVIVPPNPQITAALGAALLAYDDAVVLGRKTKVAGYA